MSNKFYSTPFHSDRFSTLFPLVYEHKEEPVLTYEEWEVKLTEWLDKLISDDKVNKQ